MKKAMSILLSLVLGLGVATGANAESEITVVSREAGSGTRSAFIELTGVEVKDESGTKVDRTYEDAVIQSGTAQVITTAEGDPNAIGYISLGSLGDTVKALEVDGVVATAENVKNGSYPISRPFCVATKDGLSAAAQDFMGFLMSEEAQKLVTDNHYVATLSAQYAPQSVKGKIVIGGSSSVAPLMEKLTEAYMASHGDVEIEVQVSDSTTGVKGVIDGTFDIGMASRELKQSELDAGLTPSVIAMDGIAVIVNKANPVSALTTEQIASIFTGETTSWDAIK